MTNFDHYTKQLRDQALSVFPVVSGMLGRKATRTRKADPDLVWAYSFAGNPNQFIEQIISDWREDYWISWHAFISSIFAVPFESEEELQIFRDCTHLIDPPEERPSRVWMPIGRRGGKSRVLSAIAVYLAVCFDWSHHLDPGELGVIPVLSASRTQARIIMGYIKAMLEHPKLKGRVVVDNAESILLQGNILIEVVTASYKAVRGRTVLAALCDEIAFWHSEETSSNPDKEIIAALEPAMATIPNALLLGASSPHAKRGVLWEQYDRWFGKEGGPLVWQADTRTMNPTVEQEYVDRKYEEDPYNAAAEIGAQFRSDVDIFISREALDEVVMRDVHEIPPQRGVKYFAFVDPSGGSSDSMTLAIGHVDPATKRGVLDAIRERRPPFSPESVVGEFVTLLKTYWVTRVRGDHYAGDWPRERFRIKGVHYDVSKKRKSDLYLAFLPILNAGRTELLDEPRLYNQLLGLERRLIRGGRETIDHQKGAHDDVANVTAGLMDLMLSKRDTTTIHPSLLAASARRVTRPSLDIMVGQGPRW
jgi:hypothetical protein